MSTVRNAGWGRWKYCTDNGCCKEIAMDWIVAGDFDQTSVRACVCVEM